MDVDEDTADRPRPLPSAIKELETFFISMDETIAERLHSDHHHRQQQQQRSTSSPAISAEVEGGQGLPLPSVLVQQVLCCLDSRSASAAAAACTQMAAAYKQISRFEPSVTVEEYCNSLREVCTANEWDDGSTLSRFAALWPLDGSSAAGADLLQHTSALVLRNLLPFKLPEAMLRPVPDAAKSSPLALFVDSKPVPLYSSRAATADVAREAQHNPAAAEDDDCEPDDVRRAANRRARMQALLNGDTRRRADLPPAPAPPSDIYTAACCNVSTLMGIEQGCPMHLDGDLLGYGYATGWKLRDPGLGCAVLSAASNDVAVDCSSVDYDHGLFSHVSQVCSDAANALVWCAADEGKRIKAFRAPEGLGGPRNADASCNSGEDNKLQVQYTFSTDVKGLRGRHAGLHVLGTKVFATNALGALFSWDIAEVPPQRKELRRSVGAESDDDDDDDSGDSDAEAIFKGELGWRDADGGDCQLEVTRGTPPQAVYRLQRPAGPHVFSRTCLLNSSAADRTLVASCAACGSTDDSMVLTYDLHTQQVKNMLLGHVFSVTDIAPAPEAWPGSENLFATCARSGDVKIWDIRLRGGAAAVTLTGDDEPMTAVVLAANRGSAASSSGAAAAGASSSQAASGSSSRNQLGAGMLCFSGGAGECVWAWDLRSSSAQALYQLSTGNLQVEALAWHEGSSSLIASCESMYQNRFGECYRDDYFKVGATDTRGSKILGLLAALGPLLCNPLDFAGLPGFGALAEGASDADSDDAASEDGETRYWPNKSKHRPEDFRAHLSLAQGSVLAYTFSERAS